MHRINTFLIRLFLTHHEFGKYYSPQNPDPLQPKRVQIQAEDFCGGISMPHYGHARPSADYFNSNLITHNFVIADIMNNRNNVYFYDERAQGKNADALCSLRLLYHLNTLQTDARNGIPPAEISFSLLDNCVGQKKSKVVLMFFAMLSIVFPYKKGVLCFLLPGHSHNIADRVVAWCRGAVCKLNVDTPFRSGR
ncbi:Cleavage inducible protein [Phytophthora megakarya]|uniref:Cleavage inducible protein n=1 Tax=Phytophthora megakarya TaxID=4795 RepID=A0A225UXL6_9STRA|nr:Cleavage inducible protein [Phytophthora megakarya]